MNEQTPTQKHTDDLRFLVDALEVMKTNKARAVVRSAIAQLVAHDPEAPETLNQWNIRQ